MGWRVGVGGGGNIYNCGSGPCQTLLHHHEKMGFLNPQDGPSPPPPFTLLNNPEPIGTYYRQLLGYTLWKEKKSWKVNFDLRIGIFKRNFSDSIHSPRPSSGRRTGIFKNLHSSQQIILSIGEYGIYIFWIDTTQVEKVLGRVFLSQKWWLSQFQ